MMNCLVTGGAGFIGSHLVEALVERGDKVRVLDNLSTGTLANLSQVRDDIEFVRGDLSNLPCLRELVDGVEVVFHLAAAPPQDQHAAEPPLLPWMYDTDLAQLLIASRDAPVRRLVFASSCGVYGRPVAPLLKETTPLQPRTAHGLAKLAGEQHCLGFTSLHGLDTVRLRYFDTIGPRQSAGGPYARTLPPLLRALIAGRPAALEGDCFSYHDLVDIDDVVHATLMAATARRVAGKAYNIARGRPVTLTEIIKTASEILGRPVALTEYGQPVSSPWPQAVDISRAATDFGFCPAIDLRRTLLSLLDWYAQEKPDTADDFFPSAPEKSGPHRRLPPVASSSMQRSPRGQSGS
jgi:UDP-glucose 4-epimerase